MRTLLFAFGLAALACGCLDEHALDGDNLAGRDLDPGAATDGGGDLDESGAPTVHITNPHDGEERSSALPVAFAGWANDAGGAPLTGGALQWTSSLDGSLGSGAAFTRTLSVGTHLITLTATATNGRSASDHLTVTIR